MPSHYEQVQLRCPSSSLQAGEDKPEISRDAGSKQLTPPSPGPSVHLVKTCLLSTTPAQLSASMKPTNHSSFGSLPSSRCRPHKQITSESTTRAAAKAREEEGKEGGPEQGAEGWRIRWHLSAGPKEERRVACGHPWAKHPGSGNSIGRHPEVSEHWGGRCGYSQ